MITRTEISKYPELAEYSKSLRRNGRSYREIADELSKKGLKVSHMAVKSFFDRSDTLGATVIQRDVALKEQVTQEVLDTANQLKKANEVLWGIIEEMKNATDDNKAISNCIKALDSITRQIDVSSKLISRLTPQHLTQNINISNLDFSIKVNNYIEKLERMGYVKLLKPLDMEADIRDREPNENEGKDYASI